MNKVDKIFYPLGFLCCFPDGPLSIDAFTPVSGYTPGQTINVKVNVNNKSKETLTEIEVQLNKVRSYATLYSILSIIIKRLIFSCNFISK